MFPTTITVSKGFPMTKGEEIRIKRPDGKGNWAVYKVGPKLSGDHQDHDVYKATVEMGRRR